MSTHDTPQSNLAKLQNFQKLLLRYIGNPNKIDIHYNQVSEFIKAHKLIENQYKVKEVVRLITKIANNRHRTAGFFDRIRQVMLLIKDPLKQFYSDDEIFYIIKSNKRLILLFLEDTIITPDARIASIISQPKYKFAFYPHYFLPEFRQFFSKELCDEINSDIHKIVENADATINDQDTFNEKRRIGENDHAICEIIRKDDIDGFTKYVANRKLSLNATIPSSPFETNSFIGFKPTELIQYAAFFGAEKIVKYLFSNKIELRPSLWFYTIHGSNPAIISLLEENKLEPKGDLAMECILESIKCHHHKITDYLHTKYFKTDQQTDEELFLRSIEVYNYLNFPSDLSKDFRYFFYCCKFDHYTFVSLLMKDNIDINKKMI